MAIRIAETDSELATCYPVMVQLRPHLGAAEFVEQVRRQRREGYHLAFLAVDERVATVAGFRFLENLAWGKFLYVDDLVSEGSARSSGHGQQMMDWLIARARAARCDELHLDSGVQRFHAHRFYLRNRMCIRDHHFALKLPPPG